MEALAIAGLITLVWVQATRKCKANHRFKALRYMTGLYEIPS